MSSSFRMELDKWLSQLEVKADRVLDIGGSQESVVNRVKRWNVGIYMIADLENPHKDSPKPDIVLDLNYAFFGSNLRDYFDQIFCLEVFDYVWNPYGAFVTIAELLAKKGTAWVSFPSVYPLHQPINDDALRYMPGGIKKLADSVGLKVKQMIYRRPETNLWEQFYKAERMRAAKHEDHNFTGFIVELQK